MGVMISSSFFVFFLIVRDLINEKIDEWVGE